MPTDVPPAQACASRATSAGPPIESVLAPLSRRYVLVYPSLQTTAGSAKAALMLSQMLYWTRKYLVNRPQRDGWFWHTRQDWQASTGLSRHEQDQARATLLATGLVEERRMGVPGRLHFRIDFAALGRALGAREAAATDWCRDEATFRSLLGRPVVFLRGLVDVGGSFAAGFYLSELCQQQRVLEHNTLQGHVTLNGGRRELNAGDGWLDLPLAETALRLGLSTRRLRLAREKLSAAGLIEERSSGGLRPRTLSRVNLPALADALARLQGDLASESVPAQNPVGPHAKPGQHVPDSVATTRPARDVSGTADSSIPQVTKPADWNDENVPSRSNESGRPEVTKTANSPAAFVTSIKGFSTQKGVSLKPQLRRTRDGAQRLKRRRCRGFVESHLQAPTLTPLARAGAALKANELTLPDGLRVEEKVAARQLLDALPSGIAKQVVADEWAGQLGLGKVRSPIGYLFGLVKSVCQGTFVPALAIEVAQCRERRLQSEAALALARSSGPGSTITESGATPSAERARRAGVPRFFLEQLQALGLGSRKRDCRP